MEGAQSPVESPLAGGFAFFSSSSQGTFDFLLSNQRVNSSFLNSLVV